MFLKLNISDFKKSIQRLKEFEKEQENLDTREKAKKFQEIEQLVDQDSIELLKKTAATFQKVREENTMQTKQIYELTKQVNEYQKDLAKCNADFESLMRQHKLLENEKKRITTELTNRIQELQLNKTMLNERIHALERSKAQELAKKDEEIAELQAKLHSITTDKNQLDLTNSRLEEHCEELNNKLTVT